MTDTVTAGMSDQHIREAIREFALRQAAGPFKAEIPVLYEMFDRLNERWLDNELKPVTITITPPHATKALADADEHSGWGGSQQMRIRPSVVEGQHPHGAYGKTPRAGWRMRPGSRGSEGHLRWLGDLLLHEMLHLLLNQRQDPDREQEDGHGRVFTALCNEIGAKMGLEAVKKRRRKGDPRELPVSAQWPFCVREGGEHGLYYGDLWERVVVEEEAEAPATPDEAMWAVWNHDETAEEHRRRFLAKVGVPEEVVAALVATDVETADGEGGPASIERAKASGGRKGKPVDPPPDEPGDWFNIFQAARRLGVTERAVRGRIERGTIPWRWRGEQGRDVWVTEPEAALDGEAPLRQASAAATSDGAGAAA